MVYAPHLAGAHGAGPWVAQQQAGVGAVGQGPPAGGPAGVGGQPQAWPRVHLLPAVALVPAGHLSEHGTSYQNNNRKETKRYTAYLYLGLSFYKQKATGCQNQYLQEEDATKYIVCCNVKGRHKAQWNEMETTGGGRGRPSMTNGKANNERLSVKGEI